MLVEMTKSTPKPIRKFWVDQDDYFGQVIGIEPETGHVQIIFSPSKKVKSVPPRSLLSLVNDDTDNSFDSTSESNDFKSVSDDSCMRLEGNETEDDELVMPDKEGSWEDLPNELNEEEIFDPLLAVQDSTENLEPNTRQTAERANSECFCILDKEPLDHHYFSEPQNPLPHSRVQKEVFMPFLGPFLHAASNLEKITSRWYLGPRL